MKLISPKKFFLVILIVVLGVFLFSKGKAQKLLSPLVDKLPRNGEDLVKGVKDVNVSDLTLPKEKISEIINKSTEILEKSPLSEPVKEIKTTVEEKIEKMIKETVEQTKQLPEKEIKVIQREICRQWLGEEFISSSSGAPNGGN